MLVRRIVNVYTREFFSDVLVVIGEDEMDIYSRLSQQLTDRKKLSALLVITIALSFGIPQSFADDVIPPPWDRTDPDGTLNPTTQAWDFTQPMFVEVLPNDIGLVGHANVLSGELFNWGDGYPPDLFPLPPLIRLENPEVDYLPGVGLVGIGPNAQVDIFIPDRIDDNPFKDIWFQVTFDEGPPPFLIEGYGEKGPFNPVDVSPPDVVIMGDPLAWHGIPEPGFIHVEHMTMFPNPDWEVLTMGIPTGTLVTQIVVDTISPVPEMETWAMMMAGIGFMGWRLRRKREMHSA